MRKGIRDRVGSLTLGSTPQEIGEYGSSDSTANNVDDTYFSGPGLLYVGMDPPALGFLLILH